MFTVGKGKVVFKHSRINGSTAVFLYGVPREYEREPELRSTLCEIFNTETGRIVASGYAICSPADTYDKETGRRKALADAIKGLSKKARTIIWDAYFDAQEDARLKSLERELNEQYWKMLETSYSSGEWVVL